MWMGVLGPLLVRHEDRQLPLPDGKQRSVLAALALSQGQAVSLDELADTVWDGSPPPAAGATLRNYVSRLRHGLGPGAADRLVTGRFGYRLQLADGELDASQLEASYRLGSTATRAGDWVGASAVLTDGLALWRGNPLTDVPSQTIQHEHGPRLEQVRLQILELRIEADLHLRLHGQLTFELYELTRRHPLHERFHAQLMLALAGCGRQADALEAFQRARRLVVDELGVDPGPELQRVHESVLAGEPVLPPGPGSRTERPAQLPSDLADFTGRSDLAERLGEALRGTGAAAVQAVSGAAGAGKTALAVHVAHRVRDTFADGQLYADLKGSGPAPEEPVEVLARLLRDLGLPPEAVPADPQERAARYRSLLAGRRLLVVLDDARDAAQIRPLLPGAGPSRVLVTSRVRLAGLDGAGRHDLDALDADEAGALFGRIVGHERVDAEPEVADQVLSACAGLPLALRIAAGRLVSRPDWSVRALADRLADERHRLDELTVGDLAVRTGFDAAYAALAAPARGGAVDPARCLRLLGSTTGPHIGLPAVSALLGVPAEEAAAALEALVDANLLGGAGPQRYRLHGLARAHAVERAHADEAPEARSTAVRGLLAWYLRTAVAAGRHLTADRRGIPVQLPDPAGPDILFDGRDAATAWLDTELPNLVAAVRQAALLGFDDIAWRLPVAVWEFVALRSGLAEAVELCEFAHAGARRSEDPEAEAYVLTQLVVAHRRAGCCHEAVFCGRQALGMWQVLGDPWMRAEVLLGCGAAHRELGRFAESARDLTEALAFYGTRGHPGGECAALLGLGSTYREAGLLAEAAASFEQCLTIIREADAEDRRAEADALAELGLTYRRLGETRRAAGLLSQAAGLLADLGDPRAADLRAEVDRDTAP